MATETNPAGSILIGALAARTGRSVHTIRWYEAQGLISGVSRDAGGRRTYREQHVGWLERHRRRRMPRQVKTVRGDDCNNAYCNVIRFDAAGQMRELTEYMDTALCQRVLTVIEAPSR